jgi:hypothetical protein
MIEEFLQVLTRLKALKRGQLWDEAASELDVQFQRLVASGATTVAQLSETELLARLLQGDPTSVVRTKTLILIALLREAGDVAVAQDRLAEGRTYYLKGLRLLLEGLRQQEAGDRPEFVPSVDVFLSALADAPLPVSTLAQLMQHFESTGQFGKAEDMLFALLEADPANAAIPEFGLAFYERLSHQTDAALLAGNLPRPELETGQEELTRRVKAQHQTTAKQPIRTPPAR